jgi:hypothetical protein
LVPCFQANPFSFAMNNHQLLEEVHLPKVWVSTSRSHLQRVIYCCYCRFDSFCFLITSLHRFKWFSCKVSNWGTVPCIPDTTMIGLYQLYPSISKANSEYNYRYHNQDSLGAYTAYRLIAIGGPTFAGILSHPPNLLGFQIGSLEGVSFASHPASVFTPRKEPMEPLWRSGAFTIIYPFLVLLDHPFWSNLWKMCVSFWSIVT